jgi:hypothetical protein
MQLPDIKALKELLKLLRSQGVLQYNSTDLQLILSENAPINTRKAQSELVAPEEDPGLPDDMPTMEEVEAYINGTGPGPTDV